MIQSKRFLLVALIAPIIALALLVSYKKYVISYGQQVVLPITGYDPRDLLSGHYLIYQVQYGVTGSICDSLEVLQKERFICFDNLTVTKEQPTDCAKFIRGQCGWIGGGFQAGIEKFYVPESEAADLEHKVRNGQASIVISLTSDGSAQVKDLLINGVSYRQK